MPSGLSQQASGISLSDTVGSFRRRKRNSIIVTVSLLIVSLLILTTGLAATTRTQNVTVGGYYPGVILGFGSFLGIIGAHLIENKRQMDLRPLYAGRCEYYSNAAPLDHDVNCHTGRGSCNLRVKSNTCYCCELYNCGKEHPLLGPQNKDVLKKFKKTSMIWNRVELMGGYHEYTDVQSCQDVIHLYHLLWSATTLNIVALFLGIITAAILGGFKDMAPTPAPDSCETEPLPAPAPCDPQPVTSSYSSYHNSTPCLPPYTAYDLQAPSVFLDSSGLSDDSMSGASAMWPTQIPPRYSPPYYPPDDKPPPYSP
uniref:Transmembrane protein 255A n=1 Tax=Paramormyrops kingsleyae TaxID=1676925 RepID=A0A3B3SUY7_9TELE